MAPAVCIHGLDLQEARASGTWKCAMPGISGEQAAGNQFNDSSTIYFLLLFLFINSV